MNFEDLKNQWKALDEKLDAGLRLNAELLRRNTLEKAKSTVRRLAFLVWVELLLMVPVILATGSFSADHIRQPMFLIPGLLLHFPAVGLIGSCIYQLVLLNQTDYAGPVPTVQKKLETLRVHRIRAVKWVFLFSSLLWTPLLVVVFKGLFGVNAWAVFPFKWMVGNVLFGVTVAVFGMWISKRYGNRMSASPRMRKFMNDLAGHNLNRALDFLAELSEFEQEPTDE